MVHPVQEDAVTLNVILHVIYGLNIQRYSPALPTLIRAINHLEDKYGVPLDRFLLPGASLVGVLLTHAAGGPGAALMCIRSQLAIDSNLSLSPRPSTFMGWTYQA